MKSYAQEIIELALASAPVGKLRIQNKNGKWFETRGQVNILIVAPFGVGKSSFLNAVMKAGLGEVITDYTLAGIIGTIKKDGTLIEGTIVDTAGRTTMLDEFQKFRHAEREALLSLMEDQWYKRSLGYKLVVPVHKKGEFYEIKAEHNWFWIKVITQFIISAMEFSNRSTVNKALLSRAFPLIFDAEPSEAFLTFLEGNKLRFDPKIQDIREKIKHLSPELSYKTAQYLAKQYEDYVNKYQLEAGYILRGLTDLSRLAGIKALIDGRTEITKEDIDNVLQYAKLQIMGYNMQSLTPSALEVYQVILNNRNGINQRKIIDITGLPRMTVYRALEQLLAKELIAQMKVGRKVYYYPKD